MSLSAERRSADLKFMAFDVLSFGGLDIMDRPYSERRAVLEKLVPTGGAALTMGPSSPDATKLWKFVEEHDLEGLISKPLSAAYVPGTRIRPSTSSPSRSSAMPPAPVAVKGPSEP
jgi:bifunctional non-homologous end joining protein LigD